MRRMLIMRRGVTAVLAMMYLVLFSTLALGFFATMTSSAQLASNDQRTAEARFAAESGIHFLKYHLEDMAIPREARQTDVLSATYDQLSARLDGTANMKGHTVGVSSDGTKIFVPGPANGYISVDGSGMEFRATIERYGEWGLRVTSVGRANASAAVTSEVRGGRGVQLEFDNQPKSTAVFDYGVAANGPVDMDSNAAIRGVGDALLGNMLINTASKPTLTMGSNALISGNVAFTTPSPQIIMGSGNTIGGETKSSSEFSSVVSTLPEPPEFPLIDTDPYKPYAGNALYGGTVITPPNSSGETKFTGGVLQNVLIKASPHTDRWVVFDGSTVINGVIYIETPNKVRFDSNVVVRGVIVVQNNPTHDYTRNLMNFDSNARLEPLSSLAGINDDYFPKALTDMSGASILAPKFTVDMDSNFGVSGGTIVADKIHFDSNAAGTLNGSVITLANTPLEMDGNANIQIRSRTGGSAGFRFTSSYTPRPGSYKEVRPHD